MPRNSKVPENLDACEKKCRLACHVRPWYIHIIRKTRSNVAKTDMIVGINSA